MAKMEHQLVSLQSIQIVLAIKSFILVMVNINCTKGQDGTSIGIKSITTSANGDKVVTQITKCLQYQKVKR